VVFENSRWRYTLLLHRLAGATTATIWTDPSILWAPSFSPDGTELAFSRIETGGAWHVWTMPLDGAHPRQVTNSDAGEVYPRYTSDGQWLVFHSWKMPHTVARVRRTGGESSVLTTSPGAGDSFADVSPDGTTLVFSRALAHGEGVFTLPVSGGTARQLTRTPAAVPRWSPDGRSIAFSGNRTYTGGVYVIGADGRGERRLTGMGGWQVWWPDGRRIGYLIVGLSGNQEIEIVPAAGGPPQRITGLRFTGLNSPFDVSPDGTMIAASDSQHVSTELWLLDPAR
jgi:TolB protein